MIKIDIKESNDTVTINDMVLSDLEKFISKKLDENSLWVSDIDVHEENNTVYIVITIEWGDWKHEHKRLDFLMYDIIYEYNPNLTKSFSKVGEDVTDDNDSDTYSSVHRYEINLD